MNTVKKVQRGGDEDDCILNIICTRKLTSATRHLFSSFCASINSAKKKSPKKYQKIYKNLAKKESYKKEIKISKNQRN